MTNLVLDPHVPLVVPVAADRLTMICFPSPPTHLEAAFVSPEPGPWTRFQLSFKPGNSFFTVRALQPAASAVVHVIWGQSPYVFELVASAHPLLVLNLSAPVPRPRRDPDQRPSLHRMRGMIDTAKAFFLLRDQHPEEVVDILYARHNSRCVEDAVETVLEEIFCFQSEGTLVVRVVYHNGADVPLPLPPEQFQIDLGDRVVAASLVDDDQSILPGRKRPVYFAVYGGRAASNMSPQGDWSIEPITNSPHLKRNSFLPSPPARLRPTP